MWTARKLSVALAALTLSSCATLRTAAFDLGELPPAWRAVTRPGARFVAHHAAGGTIVANSACNVSDSDAPLDVLTNHLLFELQDVREHGRTALTLSGRGALRTTLEAKLDGVPIALDLVVLKTDGCSVDLQLVAAPATIEARRADFDAFVGHFHLQRAH